MARLTTIISVAPNITLEVPCISLKLSHSLNLYCEVVETWREGCKYEGQGVLKGEEREGFFGGNQSLTFDNK